MCLLQKLATRQKAAKEIQWSEQEAERAAEILNTGYMSSETDGEDDASQPRHGRKPTRAIRPLAWESSALRRIKEKLDCYYRNRMQTPQQRAQCGPLQGWKLSDSSRRPPKDAPSWALT